MKLSYLTIIAALAFSMSADATLRSGQRATTKPGAAAGSAATSTTSGIVNALSASGITGGMVGTFVSSTSMQASLTSATKGNTRLASAVQEIQSQIESEIAKGNRNNVEKLTILLAAAAGLDGVSFSISGNEAIVDGYSTKGKLRIKAVIELVVGNVILNSVKGSAEARLKIGEHDTGIQNILTVLETFANERNSQNGADSSAIAGLDAGGFKSDQSVMDLDTGCGV